MLVFTPIMMINHRHKMGGFCILNSDSDFTISILSLFFFENNGYGDQC